MGSTWGWFKERTTAIIVKHEIFSIQKHNLKTNKNGIPALWSRITRNPDISTGPLARLFARTTHTFAYSALLTWLARSTALIHLLASSHSQALGKVNDDCRCCVAVLDHSVLTGHEQKRGEAGVVWTTRVSLERPRVMRMSVKIATNMFHVRESQSACSRVEMGNKNN